MDSEDQRLLGKIDGMLETFMGQFAEHVRDGQRQAEKLEQGLAVLSRQHDEVKQEIQIVRSLIPDSHQDKHVELDQLSMKRRKWDEIWDRGLLAVVGAVCLWGLSKLIPGAERWFQ
jgi:hypothetical protein